MKAGLLLPRSGAYPAAAADLTVAIRRCLKQFGREEEIKFVSENIGFGNAEKEVYSAAEKLLITEDADLLIAYADMKVTGILEPLIFATGKLLIILNTGANFPENKVPQPGIIYLTLQHSFCTHLSGKAAAGDNAVYATTFYDCGYMHGASMVETYIRHNPNLLFNYVNRDLFDDSFSITPLTDFLSVQENKKMNILCVFDTEPAALFYKKLNEYEYADRLSLFVSPMMLDKKAIGEGGYRFSIQGHTSWTAESNEPSAVEFTDLYRNEYKKEPGVFSLSGRQAGLLLNEILQQPELLREPLEEMTERIGKIELKAPNGNLSLDDRTNFYIPDKLYHCILPAGEKELTVTSLSFSKKAWDDFVGAYGNTPSSGWMNTYLCY